MGRRALVLVVLLVTSAVASSGGLALVAEPVAAGGETPPDGFVGLPEENIQQGTPASEEFAYRASNLTGDVLASDHAGTTEFVLTTPADAEERLGPNATVAGLGNLALVIRDDTNHAGRQIAIRASEVRDSLGFIPERLTGVHEDGERWTRHVQIEDGFIIVELPHFSTNVVTFTGEVELSGNPATDGSSYQYELRDLDSASNFSVNVTGVVTETAGSEVGTAGPGDSTAVDFANLDPTGPDGTGDPKLTVTGVKQSRNFDKSLGIYKDFIGMQSGSSISAEITVKNPSLSHISQINIDPYAKQGSSDPGAVIVDIYAVRGEYADGSYGEGTKVASSVHVDQSFQAIEFDNPINNVSGPVTFEFVTTGTENNINDGYYNIKTADVGFNAMSSDGSVSQQQPRIDRVSEPHSVGVASDTGESASFGDLAGGESATARLNLSSGTRALDWSVQGGVVDYNLSYTDEAQTDSPSIEINNETVSHAGMLADGETVSLPTNTSWLRDGTNRVNASTPQGCIWNHAGFPGLIGSHG